MKINSFAFYSGKYLSRSQKAYLYKLCKNNFPKSKWHWNIFKKVFLERNNYSVIVKAGNYYAGYLLAKEEDGLITLSFLYIDPAFRKAGLATKLVKRLIISSQKRRVKKIFLHFRDKNNLESFYSKLGFSNHKIVGEYSDGEKKHYMKLILKN